MKKMMLVLAILALTPAVAVAQDGDPLDELGKKMGELMGGARKHIEGARDSVDSLIDQAGDVLGSLMDQMEQLPEEQTGPLGDLLEKFEGFLNKAKKAVKKGFKGILDGINDIIGKEEISFRPVFQQ